MKIEGTKTSPSVTIENGVFEIKGRSIPEDSHDFFSPILQEVQRYVMNPSENTILHFHLEYINSGSKKYFTNILTHINELQIQGKNVIIYWKYDYDDESILELGKDLMGMFEMPFEIIEVNS